MAWCVRLALVAGTLLTLVWMTPPGGFARSDGVRPVGIRVEAIDVDAEVAAADIERGAMESPPGPWVVVWYRQLGRLGAPGNVVLAGHVDFSGTGPAVFSRLHELAAGDTIALIGGDGTVYRYAVSWARRYDVDAMPMGDVIGSSERELVTLITCTGSFDTARGIYRERLVVRAIRQP